MRSPLGEVARSPPASEGRPYIPRLNLSSALASVASTPGPSIISAPPASAGPSFPSRTLLVGSSTPAHSTPLVTSTVSHSQTRSTLRISRPIIRRTANPHATPPSPVRALASPPPLLPRSLSSSPLRSPVASPKEEVLPHASNKLQHLLSHYGPTVDATPKIATQLGSPPDEYPSHLALTAASPAALSASVGSSSLAAASSSNSSSDSAALTALRHQVSALQLQLSRAQHDAASHLGANRTLAAEFTKVEFENRHLHECLASRNTALARTEDANRLLSATIETTVAAAAHDVEMEQAQKEQERRSLSLEAQREIERVQQASRDQLRRLEATKNAEATERMREAEEAFEQRLNQFLRERDDAHEQHVASRLLEAADAHAAQLAAQSLAADELHALDLADRLRDLERTKHAEFDEALRGVEAVHRTALDEMESNLVAAQAQALLQRKRYETLTESTARICEEHARLKRLVAAQTSARRRNAREAVALLATGELHAEPTESTNLVAPLRTHASSEPSLSAALQRALLFHSWLHESHQARVVVAVSDSAAAAATHAAAPTLQDKGRTLHRLCRRLATRTLARALHRWSDTVRRAASEEVLARLRCTRRSQILNGVIRRVTQRQTANVLRMWTTFVERARAADSTAAISNHRLARITALISVARRDSQAPLFRQWRRFVRDKRRRRMEALERCADLVKQLEARRTLREWHSNTEATKVATLVNQLRSQKTARVLRLTARARVEAESKAFEIWRTFVRARRARRTLLLTRIVRLVECLQARHALRAWRRTVVDHLVEKSRATLSHHRSARLVELTRHARHHALAPVFRAWATDVRRTRAHRSERVEGIARRFDRLQARLALRRWRRTAAVETAEQVAATMHSALVRQKRARARELVSRWRANTVVPTFQAWARFVKTRRAEKRDRLARLLTHLKRATLRRALHIWSTDTGDARVETLRGEVQHAYHALNHEKRARAAAAIAGWRHRSIAPAFTAWRRRTRERRSNQKRLLGDVVRRLETAALGDAWHRWSRFTERTTATELHNKMHLALTSQKQKQIGTLVARWRLGSLTPAFLAWRSGTRATRARKRQVLERVLRSTLAQPLRRALHAWRRATDEAQVSSLRLALSTQKRARARAVIVAWRTRCVLPAFHAWRARAAIGRTRKRQTLARVLDRLTRASLHAALARWHHHVVAHATNEFRHGLERQHALLGQQLVDQKRRRFQAMVARWAPPSKHTLFVAWRSTARSIRSRKLVLVRRAVERLVTVKMREAWRTWRLYADRHQIAGVCDLLQHRIHNMRARHLSTIVQRSDTRTTAPVFQAWRTYTRNLRARRRSALERVLRFTAAGTARVALRRWQAFIVAGDKATLHSRFAVVHAGLRGELADQKQRYATSLITRWRLSSLAPTFAAWRRWAHATRSRKQTMLRSVLHRLAHQTLWRAFHTWTVFAHSARTASMRREFDAHTTAAREEHARLLADQKRARARHMIDAWRQRGLAPIFVAWCAFAKENRRRKTQLLGQAATQPCHADGPDEDPLRV